MFKTILVGLASALISTAASAEVIARGENSFSLSFERPVSASADAVFQAVGRPAAWWSDAHTYSGSSANIRLNLTPGGCWCEDLPGGGVRHAEAILVMPERRLVRFNAPFGPLQAIGAGAVLTMSWPEVEGQRTLRWTFVVSGSGAGAMADAIDGVMAEQFARLAAHLEADEAP